MKKSRLVTIIGLLLCFAVMTASCGNSTDGNTNAATAGAPASSASPTAETAAGGGGPVTIKAVATTGGSGKSLAGTIKTFNEAFAGKINLQVDMIAHESLLETMMLQFVSGSASYDLLSTVWVPATKGYMEPLNSYLDRDGIDAVSLFGKGVMTDATKDGTFRVLPYRNQCYIVFYREDLFKEANLNPPTTMEEYLDCARKLTVRNSDGSVKRYGCALKMQSPTWTTETFSVFFMPLGGFFLTEDLKHASPTLTSQLSYDVMKTLKTLQDEKLCPDPLSFTYDDNVVGMQTDLIALSIESSARTSLMEDPEKSKVVGKFNYTYIKPQQIGNQPSSNYSPIWCLGIDKNSKHKDEAWEFIKWATSLDQQKYMAKEFANGPSILSIYDDPEYQKSDKGALATKEVLQVLPRDFVPVLQTAEIQQVIHDQLQNYMLGSQDEVATGKNMYDKIEAILTAS